MREVAPIEDGVWQFDNGEEYYSYLLHHYTSTDLTADEIHQLGITELERIHGEMREIFSELGYPEDESIYQSYQQVANDGGIIPGNEMVAFHESIIEQANINLGELFEIQPEEPVVVIGGPIGGFYSPGSIDGTRPGAFYAEISPEGRPYFNLPSLTYHEAIPGHHFQIALAHEVDLPLFRNLLNFNAYVEGWALYAERLAWEAGWYEDDPFGDLGRLQFEAFRAARLVVDTGIHTKGWTFNHAVVFFMDNAGFDRQFSEQQIARYIVLPGQSTGYMIGMLKILELRQIAMEQLGDQFDLKQFHTVILQNGSMPLDVLEGIVQDYIAAKLAE
jgi:uncharacterized protein (DUF885 family)